MKLVIIILIILAVILAAALIWTAMNRKKDKLARVRAGELRSDAATTASDKRKQEASAREAQAEADRVRAQADKLEVRADEERTSYDMTRAQQEDSLRAADRLDPDVDHRSQQYKNDLDGKPTHRGEATESGTLPRQPSAGPANPVQPAPETGVSEQEQAAYERDQERRDQV